MPAQGRSSYRCRDCRADLAIVRGQHPHRRLIPIIDAAVKYREDGKVEIDCPSCGRANMFEWLSPIKTEDLHASYPMVR